MPSGILGVATRSRFRPSRFCRTTHWVSAPMWIRNSSPLRQRMPNQSRVWAGSPPLPANTSASSTVSMTVPRSVTFCVKNFTTSSGKYEKIGEYVPADADQGFPPYCFQKSRTRLRPVRAQDARLEESIVRPLRVVRQNVTVVRHVDRRRLRRQVELEARHVELRVLVWREQVL